jgi:cystathionine gamma-synthase
VTRRWRPETLAVHLGLEPDAATGALVPPLHLATTFERDADGGYPRGFVYARSDNPTRAAFEAAMATLEGGREAAAFASGSAAAAAVLRAVPASGHAIVPDDMYHGLRTLLERVLVPAGLRVTAVDMSDLAAVRAAVLPETRLLWVETPSNPQLKVTDIAGVVTIAREAEASHGAPVWVAVDGTWTPPPWQPAFVHGVDLVVHATTKYLSGHSDVLGGVVVAAPTARPGDADPWPRVRDVQRLEGAVAGPFDAWLALRGLRTLAVRLAVQAENAATLAAFLVAHPAVHEVRYPGLPGHPNHEVATRQMRAFGAMLSFRLAGGEAAARAVAGRVRLFTRATSLGGVESLIEHRASIEPPGGPTPADLLRVSVGIEHADDLMDDLSEALAPEVQG